VEAARLIIGCVTAVIFWLMLPMGMYVVCKLFQEQRGGRGVAVLLMFCCCGIGHIMAVNELNENGSRWGTDLIGWLYPLLLYLYGIGFVLHFVVAIIAAATRGSVSLY
jgi:hypothetical protein